MHGLRNLIGNVLTGILSRWNKLSIGESLRRKLLLIIELSLNLRLRGHLWVGILARIRVRHHWNLLNARHLNIDLLSRVDYLWYLHLSGVSVMNDHLLGLNWDSTTD